jgi:hypothetical protein
LAHSGGNAAGATSLSKKEVLEQAQAAWKNLSAQELKAWQLVLAADNSRRWELWQRKQMYVHLRDEVNGGLYRASKWLTEDQDGNNAANKSSEKRGAGGTAVAAASAPKCRRHTCERNARHGSCFCSDRCGVTVANHELFGAVNVALNYQNTAIDLARKTKKKADASIHCGPPKLPEAIGSQFAGGEGARARRIATAKLAWMTSKRAEELAARAGPARQTGPKLKVKSRHSSLLAEKDADQDGQSLSCVLAYSTCFEATYLATNNPVLLKARIGHLEPLLASKRTSIQEIRNLLKSNPWDSTTACELMNPDALVERVLHVPAATVVPTHTSPIAAAPAAPAAAAVSTTGATGGHNKSAASLSAMINPMPVPVSNCSGHHMDSEEPAAVHGPIVPVALPAVSSNGGSDLGPPVALSGSTLAVNAFAESTPLKNMEIQIGLHLLSVPDPIPSAPVPALLSGGVMPLPSAPVLLAAAKGFAGAASLQISAANAEDGNVPKDVLAMHCPEATLQGYQRVLQAHHTDDKTRAEVLRRLCQLLKGVGRNAEAAAFKEQFGLPENKRLRGDGSSKSVHGGGGNRNEASVAAIPTSTPTGSIMTVPAASGVVESTGIHATATERTACNSDSTCSNAVAIFGAAATTPIATTAAPAAAAVSSTGATGGHTKSAASLSTMAVKKSPRKRSLEERALDALGWKNLPKLKTAARGRIPVEGQRHSSRTLEKEEDNSLRAAGPQSSGTVGHLLRARNTDEGNSAACPVCGSWISVACITAHVEDCLKNALRTRRTSRTKKSGYAANMIVSRGEISVGHTTIQDPLVSRNVVEHEKWVGPFCFLLCMIGIVYARMYMVCIILISYYLRRVYMCLFADECFCPSPSLFHCFFTFRC